MIEIIPLSPNEMFDMIKEEKVSKVVFIHDYYELWFQEHYMRFKSQLTISANDQTHSLPSKDGNYTLSCLTEKKAMTYKEFDDRVEITMDNGVKIVCDTTLEPPCDNFQMCAEGLTVPVMI